MEFLCVTKVKKKSSRMLVAEGAPRYHQGHLAKELVTRGLQTTLITEFAVFAMISHANMAIVAALALWPMAGLQHISACWVEYGCTCSS